MPSSRRTPRRLHLALLILVVAAAIVGGASAASGPGYGSPACLSGNWVGTRAETDRVTRALIPNFPGDVRGRLYMIFRDGAFQYGSRQLVYTVSGGETTLIARGRFFTLAPYTASRGVFTTEDGESTTEWGKLTGIKRGKTYTVNGPPTKTIPVPGGSTPFRCRGSTLQVKLPRFASLGWITLQRGTP